MNTKVIKNLFLIAAIYDFILGIAFFFFYKPVMETFGVTLPVYPMYLQMAAAFVIAMGFGYYFVYKNLERNVDIIKLGIIYKLVYSGLTSYFYFIGMANIFFIWFAICDFIFLILFVWVLFEMKKKISI